MRHDLNYQAQWLRSVNSGDYVHTQIHTVGGVVSRCRSRTALERLWKILKKQLDTR
jgi:hypothetical protein